MNFRATLWLSESKGYQTRADFRISSAHLAIKLLLAREKPHFDL
jgi:hypothetical protein